jgi:hypothetical protein
LTVDRRAFDLGGIVITVGITMSDLLAPRLSDRARLILAGLVRSARVDPLPPGRQAVSRGMLRLDRPGGGMHYWLALDGSRLLRGRDVTEAEDLNRGFLDAMEKLGTERRGTKVAA